VVAGLVVVCLQVACGADSTVYFEPLTAAGAASMAQVASGEGGPGGAASQATVSASGGMPEAGGHAVTDSADAPPAGAAKVAAVARPEPRASLGRRGSSALTHSASALRQFAALRTMRTACLTHAGSSSAGRPRARWRSAGAVFDSRVGNGWQEAWLLQGQCD
jgi:hypothetical protein